MSNSEQFKTVENKWLGRSLSSYKALHRKTAENRGVTREFERAQTLTSARKVLFGLKRGNTPLRK